MNTALVELVHTRCWCGTPFMVPRSLDESARNSGHTMYCPHGHTMHWKQTEADKLRLERDRLKQQIAQKDDEISAKSREAIEQRERASKAEKAAARLKKRASAGTCPCCSRTFQNMAIHMRKQHPEFKESPALKIVKS